MSALSDPPTMAFLCRADLQLSSGKLAVQCAHAAVGSLQRAKKTHSRMVQRWTESSSRKVCLSVEDETGFQVGSIVEITQGVVDVFTIRRTGTKEVIYVPFTKQHVLSINEDKMVMQSYESSGSSD